MVLACIGPAAAQSLEQMAGQMVVVGFEGDGVDEAPVRAMRKAIAEGRIGGVMYVRKNIAGRAAVRAMNAAFLDASPELLPFLTVDQEGGGVERLTRGVGFKEVPGAARMARTVPLDDARALYEEQARGLADWGFNVNFAPVVDLSSNPNNPVIARAGRAFSNDAGIVASYAAQVIAAHHDMGLLTAIKHFPGHGSSSRDSHEGYVDITRSWDESELEPYRALIGRGYADFVMVGHLVNKTYSPLPASLSPEWVTGVLRNQLGFDGVVISDDLEMKAIREHYSLRETVKLAVKAGLDVLLFNNTARYRGGLGDEIRKILVEEAEADAEFRARVEQSYRRIVALKARIGDAGRG